MNEERKRVRLLRVFATVANTHSAYLLLQMRICYRSKYSQCVFATTNAYLLPQQILTMSILLPQMRIFIIGNIKGQFYSRNEYSASDGHTRKGILLPTSGFSFTEHCRSKVTKYNSTVLLQLNTYAFLTFMYIQL